MTPTKVPKSKHNIMTLLHRLNPQRSLTTRIILVNLTLTLLALGSLTLWTGLRMEKGIIEEAEAELEVRALILANGLREPVQQQLAYEKAYYERDQEQHEEETGDEDEDEDKDASHTVVFVPIGDRDFKALVDSFAKEMNARVTILDPGLTVRYSSDPRVPVHIEDRHPEILAALRQQDDHDIRFDEWTGEDRLFVAAPILGNNGIEGLVQLSVPMNEIRERVRSMWLTLMTATLALTTLFILASVFLGEQITRPLRRLTAAAHRLASGDLSMRMEMERQDELGDLAAAFDHMAEEISQLLARERAFVANASHELRSPVTSIQLRAELLQMTSPDDDRRDRYIREIHQEAENLGHLLQQLLALDRAQAASKTLPDPLDITPCIHQVIDLMQPLAQHAGLTMTADLPQSLPPVRLAEQDCQIILRNLLDNAIKYTPAGGWVKIVARVREDDVEIRVQDTGVGIPSQDLPYIFGRFYRVDKARDRTGSGLGLAMVKEIVTGAGGEVQAESKEGEGTTLVVRLPRAG